MEIGKLHIVLIILLPICGSVISVLIPNKHISGWISSIFSFLVFLITVNIYLFFLQPIYQTFEWFRTGLFAFQIGFLLDKLSATMLVIVSLITLLVNIFSIEYMKKDIGKGRYFAFLGLFAFSMYGIVLSSNLFLTFCFWELVGFASYLLIGFWYQEEEPPKASMKAFMVNRVGDAGFLIALFILFAYFKTYELPVLYDFISTDELLLTDAIFSVLGIGLFLGAVGKSAQFPLQTWLPDAMAGPTPVSALIHAATMVAAGAFMLIRVFPLLSDSVLTVIAFTGAITAFMGAFAAFAQKDIKKVLAFSTISQLGYMMVAIGSGSPDAAFFHLITHAFFKASLFLCAGLIIHKLHEAYPDLNKNDIQNMLKMGGLRTKMPLTFLAYTVAMLALCGLPFFSGFFSKDAIINASVLSSSSSNIALMGLVPTLCLLTVFMTAAYMGRQYFLVFFGAMRTESKNMNSSEPMLLILPVFILSGLSLWFWFDLNPIGLGDGWMTENLLFYVDTQPLAHIGWIGVLTTTLAISGLLLSLIIYNRSYSLPVGTMPKILLKLSSNNWYISSVHNIAVVRPVLLLSKYASKFDYKIVDGLVDRFGILNVVLSQLLGWFDRYVVDGLINLLAFLSGLTGKLTSSVQGGRVQNYFVWALVGILLIYIFVL